MSDVQVSSERAPLAQVDDNVTHDKHAGRSPLKPIRLGGTPQKLLSVPAKTSEESHRVGLFAADSADQGYDHIIVCSKSVGLLFGRARTAADEENDESLRQSVSQDQHVAAGNGVPIRRVMLPNSARHVSRDHCIVYHTPFGGNSWAVKILGQNGLIVNQVRHRPGSILRLTPNKTTLDFFGVSCLFVGSETHDEQDEKVIVAAPTQDGRSPSKANARLSDVTEQLRSVASSVAVVGPNKRFVGNAQKRPSGAPVSPPTSSPAPFDLSSSPVKRVMPPPPSSPFLADDDGDDDDDEDDDDYDDEQSPSRTLSPSLQRRAGKTLNSDIMLRPTEESNDVESEDEASQALAMSSKAPSTKAVARSRKRSSNSALDESKQLSRSNTASPRPLRADAKRVKFTPASSAAQAASSPAPKSQPVLASTMQAIQSHFRTLVGHLACTYDLQGLLAGAIVFHRTATISATEAVRSVLSSNPGLMRGEVGPEGDGERVTGTARGGVLAGWTYEEIVQNGTVKAQEADKDRVEVWQRKAWRECLEACLLEGECFGIIQRAGKDASGNPLECWYYYDKDQDPDEQRAANLGAFVKPMRAALKTHKPIFWRKSAYGTTSDEVVRNNNETSSSANNATESQWGSSGSTLKSALLSSGGKGTSSGGGGSTTQRQSSSMPVAWEETQVEENEQTWDREGDMDFEVGSSRRANKRRK